jgi:D-tyrosyl-tRNA(Tyr) deacylase
MRIVLQRVARSEVRVGDRVVASGGPGLVLLVGIGRDEDDDLRKIAERIYHLRIFEDDDGKMNRSLAETGGDVVVVPQFTLYADLSRGRRPSWSGAAPAEIAESRVEAFAAALASVGASVQVGAFGQHMAVELVNDGPVTMILEGDRSERPADG